MIDAIDRAGVLLLYEAMGWSVVRVVVIALTCIGYGWTYFLLVPVALVKTWRRFAVGLGGTLIATWILLSLVKLAVPRVRPYIALGLKPIWSHPTDGSFPSGHAAGAFAVAAFVTVWLRRRTSASACRTIGVLWTLAVGVALSRVFLAVHYPTDVGFGALLGIVVGTVGGVSQGKRNAAQ
ncbi:MAG: phosphatase PAP2 family protein [Polyangiaceae bacterium]